MTYEEFTKKIIILHTTKKAFNGGSSVQSHIIFNKKLFSKSIRKFVSKTELEIAKNSAIEDAYQKYIKEKK
jgi:TusA-related sulfurtransferase